MPWGVYRMESGLGRPAVTVLVKAEGPEPVLDLGVWFAELSADGELPGDCGGVGRGFAKKSLSLGRKALSIVDIVSGVESCEDVEKVEMWESLLTVKIRGGEYGDR